MTDVALNHDHLPGGNAHTDVLSMRAHIVYALYKTHNCLRHYVVSRRDAAGAFAEHYREAVLAQVLAE